MGVDRGAHAEDGNVSFGGREFWWTGNESQQEGSSTVGVAILNNDLRKWPRPAGVAFDVFYFEITVVDAGDKGYIALGWAKPGFERRCKQPGWSDESYGYHGDDGGAYAGFGWPRRFGPTFTTGSVVGSGLLMPCAHSSVGGPRIFYTLDGALVGTPFSSDEADVAAGAKPIRKDSSVVAWAPTGLRPTIGLHSRGERVRVNFGGSPTALLDASPPSSARPFEFDLSAYVESLAPSATQLAPSVPATASALAPGAAEPFSPIGFPMLRPTAELAHVLRLLPWAVHPICILSNQPELSEAEEAELRTFAALQLPGALHPSWGAATVQELPLDALRHLIAMLLQHMALAGDDDDDEEDDEEDGEEEDGDEEDDDDEQ